jgi:hypothetical protein
MREMGFIGAGILIAALGVVYLRDVRRARDTGMTRFLLDVRGRVFRDDEPLNFWSGIVGFTLFGLALLAMGITTIVLASAQLLGVSP